MRATLRIAVVAPLVAALRERQPYGNHIFLADLARGLAARGHHVVVYAARGSRVHGVVVREVDVEQAARGRFALLHGHEREASRAMAAAFERLFASVAADGCDVVSQHAFDAEAIEAAAGLPALHTLHLPPMRPEVVAAARGCDAALASVSRHCAAAWRAATGRAVAALPNGVPDLPMPRVGVRPIAICAGRISREKGIATALRVARRAGLEPWIVGEIYDPEYFEAEVVPVLGDARLLPACPREEVRAMMAGASVTLMPVAWEEPFGLVAVEAQMAGCPVAGYRRGALPEVVEDGVGGCLAEADDEDGLVAAIDRARRLDRGRMRALARARFGMAACLDRYERELRVRAS